MRKEYASPSIQRVTLKADEAVLTACKTWSSGGTGAYMPGGIGTFGNCNVVTNPQDSRCNILGS